MKAHIEYDDFGEYVEILEEDTVTLIQTGDTVGTKAGGIRVMKKMIQKIMLIVAAITVMFCTSSYASGTCGIKGCYRSTVYGGSYCSKHTCSKSGCKNLAVDGEYCSEHQKNTYGSSSGSSVGSSGSKIGLVSGCSRR